MTNEEAIKELRDMLKRDISEYGSEGSEHICEAVARAIAALDAAEKQEKNDEALMRIAAIMENIAPMIHRALAAIIDFYGEDDEENTAADPCDNDCEHCDWATCPKEEAADEQ